MIISSNIPQSFSSQSGIKVTQSSSITKVDDNKSINEAVKLDLSSNETIIQARNGYVNEEKEAIHKVINDYYRKVVEDNKKFENPLNHVYRKYNDPNYSYYVKDLTQDERFAAFHNEYDRQRGFEGNYAYLDPILTRNNIKPPNDYVERAEERVFNRESVNNQFQTILNNYGITIPKDEKLIFTIEPNYFTLKVNGAKDDDLAKTIEDILNKNSENVKQLFSHIIRSKFEENSQFTKEKQDKLNIVNSVKEVTGYNLADLEVKGDKFLTPDGVDVFEIYKENFGHRKSLTEMERNYVLIEQQNQLTELARKGFENVPDLILSIEYENGSFYDIGQKENFGTGKNSWIDEMKEEFSNFDYDSDISVLKIINQYTQSINKYDLINEISNVTGFNLNDLKEENGRFLTNKGEDISELYKKSVQSKYAFSKDLQEAQINHYGKLLNELSKIGLNNIPNFEPKKEEDLMQILNKIEPLEIYV